MTLLFLYMFLFIFFLYFMFVNLILKKKGNIEKQMKFTQNCKPHKHYFLMVRAKLNKNAGWKTLDSVNLFLMKGKNAF